MSSLSTSSKASYASLKKPKRPLTPYNLFYRFKRSKIIQASLSGSMDKAAILKIVQAVPGLEDMSSSELKLFHPKDLYHMSKDIVCREMQDNLLPFEGKRAHRKINGMMLEFIEMGRMMCDQWKLVDEPIKCIFKELAEEGKKLHRERLSEYNTDEVEISTDDQDTEKEDSVQDVVKVIGQLQESKDAALRSDHSQDRCFTSTEALPVLTIDNKERSDDFSLDCTPCSPRPTKYGKVNIVTPVTSRPKVVIDGLMTLAEPLATNDEGSDEFCQYIDSHIHLVEGAENNALDLDLDDSIPKTFMDLITMDESIDHCRLAAV